MYLIHPSSYRRKQPRARAVYREPSMGCLRKLIAKPCFVLKEYSSWEGTLVVRHAVLTLCLSQQEGAVKGQDCFIEPSTGHLVPLRAGHYHGVQAVWNHDNFWVNLQRGEEGGQLPCSSPGFSFDLTSKTAWVPFQPYGAGTTPPPPLLFVLIHFGFFQASQIWQ
jgi:hypothetical protein